VNGNGAYEGEMREVALFENALLAAVPTQPDPRLEAALVPRLAEAARASTVEAETRPIARRPRRRSRRALVARVGIAVAAVPLVLAGLAFAGATVPSAARSAFDSVGITLPNQPAKHSEASGASGQGSGAGTAKGMESPQSATPPATEKGNSAAAHRHALEQHRKAHGKAVGHSRGKAIGLNGAAPPGHTGQTGPPSHSNAGGSSSSDGNGHESAPSQGTHVPQGNANGHSK
jgi:hypothetical protein